MEIDNKIYKIENYDNKVIKNWRSKFPLGCFGLFRDGESADFGATEISLPAPGPWRNVFTGTKLTGRKRLPANELFREFPVVVLCAQDLG